MSILNQVIHTIKLKNTFKKIVIVGSGAVGKTSLLRILTESDDSNFVLETNYERTPFMNIDSKKVEKDGEHLIGHLQFYDLAGQKNLPIHALMDFSKLILGHTDVIFLVFANNNLQSFLDLKTWYEMIKEGLNKEEYTSTCKFILIANKIDLQSNIDENMVDIFSEVDQRFKGIFKISCKTKEGISSLNKWIEEELFSN